MLSEAADFPIPWILKSKTNGENTNANLHVEPPATRQPSPQPALDMRELIVDNRSDYASIPSLAAPPVRRDIALYTHSATHSYL